ncbi:MAG: DMT family transporter [Gammaproteobacteria bacterium]|nr:DMT family transporter [Gammaproteobacteria bacterium]
MSQELHARAHQDHVIRGMAAAMGAHFLFAIMIMLAKLLSANHSVIEIAFYRNLIGSVPFLFLIFALGRRDILKLNTKPLLVGLRAVLGTASLVLTFYAYSLMPLADTAALLFASSLFIPVLAVLILKESVGLYRWSAVVAGFVGVIVMVRPTGDVFVFGIAVALCTALLHAILQIILRYLGRFESPETISFYFFTVGAAVTAIAMPFVAVSPSLREVPLLLGVGLSGAAAQWLLSVAYKNAPAAVVTVFNYTSIIWATLFGWMIWNEWPLPAVITGASIVIASNVLIIWRESRLHRRALADAA